MEPNMKEEYVIKMTQTEAEALAYMVGCQKRQTPVFDNVMFDFLEKEVFIKNNIKYRRNVRNDYSTTLTFYGF
jgi:hypothetical protein